jgi:hypothetical protein
VPYPLSTSLSSCSIALALNCLQVRCLLRVSIFHTAFLRGIFPHSYFKSVEAAGLDGAPC